MRIIFGSRIDLRCSHFASFIITRLVSCLHLLILISLFFFFSSRRRHTRFKCDWSSDVCSSDLVLAFEAEYVTPAGRVLSDSETAYALVLQFGLLRDAEQRRHAGKRLAALVRDRKSVV